MADNTASTLNHQAAAIRKLTDALNEHADALADIQADKLQTNKHLNELVAEHNDLEARYRRGPLVKTVDGKLVHETRSSTRQVLPDGSEYLIDQSKGRSYIIKNSRAEDNTPNQVENLNLRLVKAEQRIEAILSSNKKEGSADQTVTRKVHDD